MSLSSRCLVCIFHAFASTGAGVGSGCLGAELQPHSLKS